MTHYWLPKVIWEQKRCVVDCLIDISKKDGEHLVVERNGALEICSSKDIQNKACLDAIKILGLAKKWVLFEF